MTTDPDPETLLIARANDELMELRAQFKTINFIMQPNVAMMIVGALQLACRHPVFKASESYPVTQEFIAEIAKQFEDCPALKELIQLGNDLNHDKE